jgi:hypothetical protein
MTRLPREWVALLAISGGLWLAPGCSRTEPGPTSTSVASSSLDIAAETHHAPPALFAPSQQLSPLPAGGSSPVAEPAAEPLNSGPSMLAQYEGIDQHAPPVIVVPPAAEYSPPSRRGAGTSIYDLNAGAQVEVAPAPHGPELSAPQGPATQTTDAQITATPSPRPALERTPPTTAEQPPTSPFAAQPPSLSPAIPQSASRPVVVLQPVGDQAIVKTRTAYRMAQRGMLFAARDEVTGALHMLAQALDAHHATTAHSSALSAGMIALREAADFAPPPGRDAAAIRVGEIARTHRTPVLDANATVPPIVAQQHYYAFAQQQLAFAGGGQPAASQALYTLGRIQAALASQPSAAPLHGPGAIVFHQAALVVDSRNYLAANELGVLLARYGQLTGARQALLHSVTTRPHAEGWHNLAIVHERLGEADLAKLARSEQQLLARGAAAPPAAPTGQVQWVDAQTFAASGAADTAWPPSSTATAAQPNNVDRR